MEISKDLVAASSAPVVLAIPAEQESYGYAILQRVREGSVWVRRAARTGRPARAV